MPTAFAATWGNGAARSSAPTPSTTPFRQLAAAGALPGAARRAAPLGRRAHRPAFHARRRRAGRHPRRQSGDGAARDRRAARFFGEPAEKVCGSKPVHAAKGYFDGADAFICLPPAERQHHDLGNPLRLLLERGLHLRMRRTRSAGAAGALAEPRRKCRPSAHRRARRPAPSTRSAHVHDDQIHQGGDVPAHRHLDPQRIRPRRRRRHLRQPAAALQPDPVFLALAAARYPAAHLRGPGEQRQAGRRGDRVRGLCAMGDQNPASAWRTTRWPISPTATWSSSDRPPTTRRPWSSAARSSAIWTWNRWRTLSPRPTSELTPPQEYEEATR